jgi:hypothetical protein
MPNPAPTTEYPNVVTTVEELDAAPKGYIAVDKYLLVYFKPFHASNEWLLGGFTERFPASAISLPARLYKLSADGDIVPAAAEAA